MAAVDLKEPPDDDTGLKDCISLILLMPLCLFSTDKRDDISNVGLEDILRHIRLFIIQLILLLRAVILLSHMKRK